MIPETQRTKYINTALPMDHWRELHAIALARHVPVSQLVRDAVALYLRKEPADEVG